MFINISKGKTWPDSFWKRLKYNNFIGFTFKNYQVWQCSTKFHGNKPFSIKLNGFSEVRPFSWKRIKYGSWDEFLNFTHEDSDRFICKYNGDDKVTVSTYAYRKGLGPATNSKKAKEEGFTISEKLGVVKNGEPFKVSLNVDKKETVYCFYKIRKNYGSRNEVWDLRKKVSVERDSKSLARFWTYAHADGHHGSHALGDVDIEIAKL